jgi:hypothetical protein
VRAGERDIREFEGAPEAGILGDGEITPDGEGDRALKRVVDFIGETETAIDLRIKTVECFCREEEEEGPSGAIEVDERLDGAGIEGGRGSDGPVDRGPIDPHEGRAPGGSSQAGAEVMTVPRGAMDIAGIAGVDPEIDAVTEWRGSRFGRDFSGFSRDLKEASQTFGMPGDAGPQPGGAFLGPGECGEQTFRGQGGFGGG